MGPITKVLSQYPRVKGLGVGAFGEFSTDLEELLELTARALALEYADTYAVPEDRGGVCVCIRAHVCALCVRACTRVRSSLAHWVHVSVHLYGMSLMCVVCMYPLIKRSRGETGPAPAAAVSHRSQVEVGPLIAAAPAKARA